MPCRPLCGLPLRRPHLTCLNCRTRKAYTQNTQKIRIGSKVTFTVPYNVSPWRRALLKTLASLYAFVSG